SDGSSTVTESADVEVVNLAPIIEGENSVDGREGIPVALSLDVVDPGGDPLRFAWDFGDDEVLEGDALPSVVHTFADDGVYNATLTVTDDADASAVFDIFVPVSNVLPILLSSPPIQAAPGEMYAYTALAYDPGADD